MAGLARVLSGGLLGLGLATAAATAAERQPVPPRAPHSAAATPGDAGDEAAARPPLHRTARPRLLRSDRDLVARVLAENRVRRGGDEGGWSAYLGHLAVRAWRWVGGWIVARVTSLANLGGFWRPVAWGLTAAGITAGLAGLFRLALRRRRRGDEAVGAGPGEVAAAPRARRHDPAEWRSRAEELVAAGRIADALAALWWWVATGLAGERAEAAWTSRELAERSGRRDLLPLLRTLDGMTYGPRPPAGAEVRELAGRLESALQ